MTIAPSRLRVRRLFCEPLEARDVPSSVTGTVFQDLNQNGVQDPGEAGLAGFTVFTDNNRNSVFEPVLGEASAQTDATGTYSVDTTNVPPLYTTGGVPYDVVTWDLASRTLPPDSGPPGTGGRWLNTTVTFGTVTRAADPAPGLSFGSVFCSNADAGFAPTGPEQLLNATTAGQQTGVSVASDAAGDYVVVWHSQDANGVNSIVARVFNADGTPRTGELTVTTSGVTAVAMASRTGQFEVGWQEIDAATGNSNVWVRNFTIDGVPISGPTPVAPSGSKVRRFLDGLASDANGNFVLGYKQETLGGWWGTPDLKVQRFTAAGALNGNSITVASLRLVGEWSNVGMADSGNFVVAYQDAPKGSPITVFAQRYDATGRKTGGLITVDSNNASKSNVAMNAAGQFAVTWHRNQTAIDLARVYNADGTPAGPIVQMNNRPYSNLGLTIDGNANVTMAWTDPYASDTRGGGEVRVSLLPAGATAARPETLANPTTLGSQLNAGLAATPNGGFIAAWQGNGPGDNSGVFAQHFMPVAPLAAAGGSAAGTTPAPLTDAQLPLIVREAVRRWNATGLTAAERDLLRSVEIHVGDLDGATLGVTAGTTVTIDRDATGYGWFVDKTPWTNSEFHRKGDQGEQHHIDLLTAVMHELGHVLGRDHAPEGVMRETLAVGTRESLLPGAHLNPGRPGWFLSSGRH